jgi:hypothetical protein
LQEISNNNSHLEWLSKLPNANANLSSVLCDALENYPIFAKGARNFLVKLKAEGKFALDAANVEWNFDDDFFSA